MMMCSLTLQEDNIVDDHDNNPIGDENSSTTTTPPTATTTNGLTERPSSAVVTSSKDSAIDENPCTEEGRSSSDTNNQEQYICGICLDPLGRSANVGEEETTATTTGGGQQNYNRKKFGLLTACDHIFCINCLRTWRFEQKKKADAEQHSQSQQQQQRPNDDVFSSSMSQRVRACPECRQVSDFVVPSDRYVTGTEKQKAISEYQARLSCIQCKRFDGTLGSCPFGKDCFYAHYSTSTVVVIREETITIIRYMI